MPRRRSFLLAVHLLGCLKLCFRDAITHTIRFNGAEKAGAIAFVTSRANLFDLD
jgi:hypothetical protein